MWQFTIFARYTLNHWKMLCYRLSKRLIDFFTETMCCYQTDFVTDNCFWRFFPHNNVSKRMDSRKVIVLDEKSRLNHYIYIISWDVLDAFVWPFFKLNTTFKRGVNRINHWIDHWFIFVETSISNTLSTAKFIWNFPLRPERKINFRYKKFGPPVLSVNCVQNSVGAAFRHRKSLERIRRMRNVTIYNFRQVHLEPLKNAMLLPVKTFDWLLIFLQELCLLSVKNKKLIFLWKRVFQMRYRQQSWYETFRWVQRWKLFSGRKIFDSFFCHQAACNTQWECHLAILRVYKGLEGWEMWPITIFARYPLNQ